MSDKKERVFVKPELIKFDKPLDEVTLCQCGSPCNTGCGSFSWGSWLK